MEKVGMMKERLFGAGSADCTLSQVSLASRQTGRRRQKTDFSVFGNKARPGGKMIGSEAEPHCRCLHQNLPHHVPDVVEV